MMDYQKEFKRLRRDMNWSKSQLADVLGYSSEEEVSRIENGSSNISKKAEDAFNYTIKLIELGCQFNLGNKIE
tara:strand:+ start:265 stop:483 length:219 start_codon:yes stop_codon:yes gene_type:complete